MRYHIATLSSLLVLFCITVSAENVSMIAQDSQPGEPPRSRDEDPPRSLDELLGIEEESADENTLLEERDRKNLDDKLQERSIF